MANNKIKTTLLICALFITHVLLAQRPLEMIINFNTDVLPKEFSAYFNENANYTITLINYTDQPQEVYFLAQLIGVSNGVFAKMQDQYKPTTPYLVGPNEVKVVTSEELGLQYAGLTIDDLIIEGIPDLNINGNLPEGEYAFCINAYHFGSEYQPLSVGCVPNISIHYGDQLVITYPAYDEEVIPVQEVSNFTWLYVIDPFLLPNIEYEIKILDLTDNTFPDIDELFKDGATPAHVDRVVQEPFYIYNADGSDFPLEEGRKYGIRILPIDPLNEIQMSANEYSQIRTFWYGYNSDLLPIETTEPQQHTQCELNCEFIDPIATTPHNNPSQLSTIQISHFEITNLNITSGSSPTISGTGEIVVPWLNDVHVAVQLNGLQVNSTGRAYGGSAIAIDESSPDYSLSDLQRDLLTDGSTLPNHEIAALTANVTTDHMVEGLLGEDPTGLPLGMRQYVQGKEFTLAIIDMQFFADKSTVSMINVVSLGSIAEDAYLALGATDVCLTPVGLGGEFILHQAADITSPAFAESEITFFGGAGDEETVKTESSYMEVDCEGIKSFAIRGEIAFPRDLIVPDENGTIATGKAKGSFDLVLDRDNSGGTGSGSDPLGTQLLLGFNMGDFQITGIEGWTYTGAGGWLDLSDVENPPGINFPSGFDLASESSALQNTFQGVYIPSFELLTPGEFANGDRFGTGLDNFIFDNTGITVDVLALDLLEIGTGNFDGWGFSIDTFGLLIVQNNLINGRMAGAISPPLVGDEDYLAYRAIIDKNEYDNYGFTAMAMPSQLVDVPVAFATAALCPNSYVKFTLSPDERELSAFLKGQMVMSLLDNMPDDMNLSNETVIPDLNIRLADFQLNFDSQQGFITNNNGTGSSFGFGLDLQDATCGNVYEGDIAEFGFEGYEYDADDLGDLLRDGLPNNDAASASPQETMEGFPLSIGDFEISLNGNNADIDFNVELSLAGEDLSFTAGGRLELNSRLDLDANGLSRIKPYNIGLECLWLGGSSEDNAAGIGFDPFLIKGSVCLIDDNGTKGFTGELSLGLGLVNAELNAGFGTQGTPDDGDYGTSSYYGWWYLDGMVRMSPGIPIPPVAQFNGLGGGVYWNIDAPNLTVSIDDVMNSSGNTALPTFNPNPIFGRKAFSFKTSWSLVADQVMIIDPEVSATFQGNSIQSLSLGGDFYTMATSYANRTNARLWGTSLNSLLFQDFGGGTKLAVTGYNDVKADIIPNVLYGSGADKRLIETAFAFGDEDFFPGESSNSDPDDVFWFFNAGNPYLGPDDVGGVEFALPGFNLSESDNNGGNLGIKVNAGASAYAMFGQNIPSYLPDPPGKVAQLFGMHSADDGDNEGSFDGGNKDDDRDPDAANTGNGIVFGAHAYASCGIYAVFYANFSIFAGLDLMLFDMSGQSCFTSSGEVENPGANGWYGQGRAYAGVEGSIGAKGKIFGKEINVKVMELVAAMMVSAGGPDPMWLDGRGVLEYRLLGGAIKGTTRMMVEVGEKCTVPQTSPFNFPIIAETYPNEDENIDISPYVVPTVNFTMPVNEYISVPYFSANVQEIVEYNGFMKIKPIFTENDFEILEDCNNCTTPSLNGDYSMLKNDDMIAEYHSDQPFYGLNGDAGKKQYQMKIGVTAEFYNAVLNQWEVVKNDDGTTWKEERDFTFKTTGLNDPLPTDAVAKTKPLTDQKFFMLGEMEDKMYIQCLFDEQSRFYSEKDGKEYEYFAVFKNAITGNEITREELEYIASSHKFRWEAPDLSKNTEYIVQLVRKNVIDIGGYIPGQVRILIDQDLLSDYSSQDLSFEYTVETDLPAPNPESAVGTFETLLYSFRFETSKHNTLSEKLANATITTEEKDGYIELIISGTEGFDEYDVNGLYVDEVYNVPPRVDFKEPFTSDFIQNVARPVLETFANEWNLYYEDEPTGLEAEGPDMEELDDLLDQRTNWGGQSGTISTDGMEGSFGGQATIRGPHSYFFEDFTKVTLDFPRLPWTNFDWTNIDGESYPLNEFVKNGGIVKLDEEDDGIAVIITSLGSLNYNNSDIAFYKNQSGPNADSYLDRMASSTPIEKNNLDIAAGGHTEYLDANNALHIKYHVTDYVIQDAEIFLDFGEEWSDKVRGEPFGNTHPFYQSENDEWIDLALAILESNNRAISGSALVNEYIEAPSTNDFSTNGQMMMEVVNHNTVTNTNPLLSWDGTFSNSIKLVANKSFENNGSLTGSSKTINFSN